LGVRFFPREGAEMKEMLRGLKFKDILGINDATNDEAEELGKVIDSVEEIREEKPTVLKTEFLSTGDTGENSEKKEDNIEEDLEISSEGEESSSKVSLKDYQTVFVDPKKFSECKKIANYIKDDKIVTVNLEYVDNPTAQRIIDFLSGAMSIKEAQFIEVSKKVYMAVPKKVQVLYDGKSESIENGFLSL
jgi:cell division inhibitor SepF